MEYIIDEKDVQLIAFVVGIGVGAIIGYLIGKLHGVYIKNIHK